MIFTERKQQMANTYTFYSIPSATNCTRHVW